MFVTEQIQQILAELPQHQTDLNWLSSCAVQLSVLLYNLGDEVAGAELLESQTLVEMLEPNNVEGGKKMSVAEAEKRAVSNTNNNYGRLKFNYQSLIEIIQSLKKKVDSASSQLKAGVG